MGERRESGPHCSRCGTRCNADGCPRCRVDSGDDRAQLVALPGDDAPAPPGEVPLLREIKGTAVRDPDPDGPSALQQLSREHAPRPADPSKDDRPANLLHGPGYRRRRRVPWRWLLWLAGLAACWLLWR